MPQMEITSTVVSLRAQDFKRRRGDHNPFYLSHASSDFAPSIVALSIFRTIPSLQEKRTLSKVTFPRFYHLGVFSSGKLSRHVPYAKNHSSQRVGSGGRQSSKRLV
ncbi:hypothetical protein FRB91_009613 [Serendipita sp. 411]|nr:hypothetical protein FRB91_009613 [Serendipita sp. 411]